VTHAIAARATTYRGIEMRSRLEARFAGVLDDLGVAWRYEPRALASRDGQYLPDFVSGATVIEVKPRSWWQSFDQVVGQLRTWSLIVHGSGAGFDRFLIAFSTGMVLGLDLASWALVYGMVGHCGAGHAAVVTVTLDA
jgi:hypothetical protein